MFIDFGLDRKKKAIKAIEFKYFTIGLECGEENVLIVFHFHKCELKENKQRHDDIILLQR